MLKRSIQAKIRRASVRRMAEKRKKFRKAFLDPLKQPLVVHDGLFPLSPVERKFLNDYSPRIKGKSIIYIQPTFKGEHATFTLRFQGKPSFLGQAEIKINGPSHSIIWLNRTELDELRSHGLNKNSPICIVDGLQGKGGSRRSSQKLNQSIGMPWPSFLMSEVISRAKKSGLKAVLLLRPEHLPNLYDWMKNPTTAWEKEKRAAMLNLYHATARTLGFTRPKGSRYFWMILD